MSVFFWACENSVNTPKITYNILNIWAHFKEKVWTKNLVISH